MSTVLNELEAMSRERGRGEPNWGTFILFVLIGSFAIPMAIAAWINLAGYGQLNFALSAIWGIIDVWIVAWFLSLWLGITVIDLVRHLFGRLIGWSKEENPVLKVLPPILKFFVVWVWTKFLIIGFLMSFLDIEDNWDLFAGAVITGMFLSIGLPFVAKDKFFNTLFNFYWKWVLLWILFVWLMITLFPALRPWGDDAAKLAYRTYIQAKRDQAKVHADTMRTLKPKVNNLTAQGTTLQAAIATLTPKEQALFRYYNRNYVSRWIANFSEEAWPNMKVAFGDAGEGLGFVSPLDRLASEIQGSVIKQGQDKSLSCLADLKAKVDAGQAVTSENIEECRQRDPNYKKTTVTRPAAAPAASAPSPTRTASAPAPVAAPAAPTPWRWQGTYIPNQMGVISLGRLNGRYRVTCTGERTQTFFYGGSTPPQEFVMDCLGAFRSAQTSNGTTIQASPPRIDVYRGDHRPDNTRPYGEIIAVVSGQPVGIAQGQCLGVNGEVQMGLNVRDIDYQHTKGAMQIRVEKC